MDNQAQEQQYDIARLVEDLEQKSNLDGVADQKIEIVVVKSLGTTERLEVKAETTLKDAQAVTLALYKNVVTPRALTYIKETVDYQLEADRMSRVITERDKEETAKAKKKLGKN